MNVHSVEGQNCYFPMELVVGLITGCMRYCLYYELYSVSNRLSICEKYVTTVRPCCCSISPGYREVNKLMATNVEQDYQQLVC
jgi:hypothetical protein